MRILRQLLIPKHESNSCGCHCCAWKFPTVVKIVSGVLRTELCFEEKVKMLPTEIYAGENFCNRGEAVARVDAIRLFGGQDYNSWLSCEFKNCPLPQAELFVADYL